MITASPAESRGSCETATSPPKRAVADVASSAPVSTGRERKPRQPNRRRTISANGRTTMADMDLTTENRVLSDLLAAHMTPGSLTEMSFSQLLREMDAKLTPSESQGSEEKVEGSLEIKRVPSLVTGHPRVEPCSRFSDCSSSEEDEQSTDATTSTSAKLGSAHVNSVASKDTPSKVALEPLVVEDDEEIFLLDL